VVSGHCVILTYNLYFDDDDGRGPAPAGGLTSEPASEPAQVAANEQGFLQRFPGAPRVSAAPPGWWFTRLWAVPRISGRGRSRARARLRSAQGERYNRVSSRLRAGVQARAVPVLRVAADGHKFVETGFIDRVIQPESCEEVESFISTLPDYGGYVLRLMVAYGKLKVENVLHWVMLVTTFKLTVKRLCGIWERCIIGPGVQYGDVCLIVSRRPCPSVKAGERLAYPTVAQLKEEWQERDGGK
jgi:hypothetical protein